MLTFEDQLRNAQSILEITFPLLSLVKQAGTFEEIKQQVLVFKRKAKYQRRRLALIHHPDRGGDKKKMQIINHAYEFVKALKVAPAPRPVPVQMRPMNVRTYWATYTTSATTDTWTTHTY